ncbi:MAG: hypothetical protein HYV02_04765 [Deltaproteobacteria bacterium]|nr:hypothetical protein [Deltaproteobacteria bacterium]
MAPPAERPVLEPHIASLLSYVLMLFFCGIPIPGAVMLMIEKEDRLVQFHAWQSILLGGIAWGGSLLLVMMGHLAGLVIGLFEWLFTLIRFLLLGGVLVAWILAMVHAYQCEAWRIPILGDLAATWAGLARGGPRPSDMVR